MKVTKLKTRSYRLLLSLLISTLFYLILASNTFSQGNTTFGITPSIINIILSPGTKYSYTVSVKNLSKAPIPVSAKIDTFTDETGKADYRANSLSNWLTIHPQDSIILPGKTKKFDVSVAIPKKISLGGYYTSLSFTPKYRQTGSTTQVQPQIIVPILANIGIPNASEDNGIITSWEMGIFVTNKSLKDTEFSVKNLSLYHFSAKPIINFTSITGHKQIIIDQKIILPGRLRTWNNLTQIKDLNIGINKVQLLISVGEGKTISDEKFIVILPDHSPFFLLLTIFVIAIIIARHKKLRIKKALMVLFDSNKSTS